MYVPVYIHEHIYYAFASDIIIFVYMYLCTCILEVCVFVCMHTLVYHMYSI